jgi:hypothetical protein
MSQPTKQQDERLDRIEHHLRLLKDNDTSQMTLLINIENALIGSKQNGNKGIVTKIDEIEERVDVLDEFKGEVRVYVKQSKFVIGAVTLILLGILVNGIYSTVKDTQYHLTKKENTK